MSILIKGMEMPTHCLNCPFMVSRDGDDCILQRAEANENFENWEQMKAGCPLVPVPPHGRLIDADAYEELLRGLGNRDYRREKGTICDAIKFLPPHYTPTVIEAEEVEE